MLSYCCALASKFVACLVVVVGSCMQAARHFKNHHQLINQTKNGTAAHFHSNIITQTREEEEEEEKKMCFECRALGSMITASQNSLELINEVKHFDFVVSESEVKEHLVDTHAEEYLKQPLSLLKEEFHVNLKTIKVDSDGSCLPYAVSRCLVGKEILFDALRQSLVFELQQNVAFYKKIFQQGMNEETWEEHWKKILHEASPTHGERTLDKWLGPGEHLLGMANVLKRPILLLDGKMDQQSNNAAMKSGLFLPLRFSREEILASGVGGASSFPTPIVIGWASEKYNHFISLLYVQQDNLLHQTIRAFTPEIWYNQVEKKLFSHGSRFLKMKLEVPPQHKQGDVIHLKDEEANRTIKVKVPEGKNPGDSFEATIERASPALETCLVEVLSNNASTIAKRCVKTLFTLLNNLVDDALMGGKQAAKFNNLKLDNPLIVANIVNVNGAVELLKAIGFEQANNALVFNKYVDEKTVQMRDIVQFLNEFLTSNDATQFVVAEGEIKSGKEPALFGEKPHFYSNWEDARETYCTDGMETNLKKSALARRTQDGIWTFASGRRFAGKRKQIVELLLKKLRQTYEEITQNQPELNKMEWENEAIYQQRIMFITCPTCGSKNEWTSHYYDGPIAELVQQPCFKCNNILTVQQTGAFKIIQFLVDAQKHNKKS